MDKNSLNKFLEMLLSSEDCMKDAMQDFEGFVLKQGLDIPGAVKRGFNRGIKKAHSISKKEGMEGIRELAKGCHILDMIDVSYHG